MGIGIDEKDRAHLASELSKLLAESYTLYLKTHNFHWNVTGPMFQTLHLLFEQQYTELATAVDAIAERIRSLGHAAPGSYAAFSRLSSHSAVRRNEWASATAATSPTSDDSRATHCALACSFSSSVRLGSSHIDIAFSAFAAYPNNSLLSAAP